MGNGSEINRTASLLMEHMRNNAMENEQKLENIRSTMERQMTLLQQDYRVQMENIRETVDVRLEKTLDSRITQSFRLVQEQLAQVSRGLGEMRSLTNQVGDLNRVLSNVKTRGILGEYQLKGILEEILSPGQYEENVKTNRNYGGYVEFAVKLPGDDLREIYLPIDAKFPGDVYSRLVDARQVGEASAITAAQRDLTNTIKKSAADIKAKYIDPPNTTDFAIMFLPFEGLYTEVISLGLLETLQREYKVNIAGPTTMAALLNSLQMGFKTLAIQKRSGQVWRTLEAVKTEFTKFEDGLVSMKRKLEQTGNELDKLIGTRVNQINRKLKDVSTVDGQESLARLGISEDADKFDVTEEEG